MHLTAKRRLLLIKTLRVMKLTAILLLVFGLHVGARGFSQTVNFSGKDVSLSKVFKAIKKQTGYVFFYRSEDLQEAQPVTISLNETPLEAALQKVLEDQPLSFDIQGNTIVITRKTNFQPPIAVTPPAPIDVHGRVTNESGDPVQGVSVIVKGTEKGTVTDANGEFILKDIDGSAILVFSAINIESSEIKLNGKTEVALVTKTKVSKLDEVQIQAYGTTSRRLNTGNITTINSDDITRQNINNPLLALQAQVPNLIITPSSGLPGSPITLQLRGQNSLAGIKTEPLIVIDGVPFQNTLKPASGSFGTGNIAGTAESGISALSFINPQDIESINVLADAEATSIYGSRGGNGVILITTKKGKAGPTRFNASLSFGFSQVPQRTKVQVLNTQQYLQMRQEALNNDGAVAQITTPGASGYAPDLLLWDTTRYTDWQRELLGGKAGWTKANVSISGGNTGIQYLVSGTYNRQGYVYPKSFQGTDPKYEDGTTHFNLGGNSTNGRLFVSIGGSYAINNRIGSQQDFTSIALRLPPNAPSIYKSNGELNWELNPTSGINAATWINPFAILLQTVEAKTKTLISNATISYKISPYLILKLTAGYTDISIAQTNLSPRSSKDPTSLINFNGSQFVPGSAVYINNLSTSSTVDPQISFQKNTNFGQFQILTGLTMQRQQTNSQSILASNYQEDMFIRNISAAGITTAANKNSDYKYFGGFGRLNYNFQNKYLLNLSFRRDGSSRFGPQRQYGNFWSIGSGWIFTEEASIKKAVPVLSYGKIRASYGTSGNDGIGDYQYLNLYQFPFYQGASNYQGTNTLITNAANPYFSWESIRKAELALETGFFNSRLLFSMSYWRTRAGNQLGNFTLPATGGNQSIVLNNPAEIQNSGLDFVLTIQNLKSKNISWATTANFGLQYNKLLTVPDGFIGIGNNFIIPNGKTVKDLEGQPFSGFAYTYEYRGVDPNTGVYQYSDQYGKATTQPFEASTTRNRVSLMPKTLGVVNTVSLAGFTLITDIQIVSQKAKDYLYDQGWQMAGLFDPYSGLGNQPIVVLSRWQKPGDVTNVQRFAQTIKFPSPSKPSVFYQRMNATGVFSPFYVDASFIRLRNAQVSYNVPSAWVKKNHLNSANFYIQGQNLFTITGYKYADPETKSIMTLPTLRTYTIGASIGF